ncbi:MAG TPA: hypothetical protein PKU82_11290 [Bacteroidia bacterium]|nr:hypothetical protein [Bacteroidia bacterium]
MPFYRITIWLKNKRKPVSGIRFIEQSNIDIVNIQMQKQARIHYNDSLIIDVEVAMLSKNSKAVKQHQKEILSKSGKT